jgi:pyruvate/2-oxoglutarate dehydrogenase complex dihydrolipoamide acyltransferase (E2) component
VIREDGMKRRASREPTVEDLIDDGPTRIETIWREIKLPMFWTVLAFGALSAVVLAGVTHRGEERLAELPRAVETLVGRAAPESVEVARVGQEVASLREEARRQQAERSRLELRLAELERGMDDVTGSIRRQRDEVTGSIPPARRDPPAATPAQPPAQAPAQAQPASPAPPPVAEPSARPAPAPGTVSAATRSVFGVDLGVEPTLGGLRARWQRLAERHAQALGTLEPVVVVKDGPNGQPVLSLVAGPVADLGEAAALCARLRSAGAPACQPASFEGQRLAAR